MNARHIRPVVSGPFEVQNDAACTCNGRVCPRHRPAAYADMMARHATDSIAPSVWAVR